MALFDAALHTDEPVLAPVLLDRAALRSADGHVPPLLRGLVRTGRPAATPGTGTSVGVGAGTQVGAEQGAWRERLAGLPDGEREGALAELVRDAVALVLGYPDGDALPVGKPLADLGFDSLMAVQLRNALSTATGLWLPATVVFDHPTADALARHLLDLISGETPEAQAQERGPDSNPGQRSWPGQKPDQGSAQRPGRRPGSEGAARPRTRPRIHAHAHTHPHPTRAPPLPDPRHPLSHALREGRGDRGYAHAGLGVPRTADVRCGREPGARPPTCPPGRGPRPSRARLPRRPPSALRRAGRGVRRLPSLFRRRTGRTGTPAPGPRSGRRRAGRPGGAGPHPRRDGAAARRRPPLRARRRVHGRCRRPRRDPGVRTARDASRGPDPARHVPHRRGEQPQALAARPARRRRTPPVRGHRRRRHGGVHADLHGLGPGTGRDADPAGTAPRSPRRRWRRDRTRTAGGPPGRCRTRAWTSRATI